MSLICRFKGHRWFIYDHPSGPSQWKAYTGKDYGVVSRTCSRCGHMEYESLDSFRGVSDG